MTVAEGFYIESPFECDGGVDSKVFLTSKFWEKNIFIELKIIFLNSKIFFKVKNYFFWV